MAGRRMSVVSGGLGLAGGVVTWQLAECQW